MAKVAPEPPTASSHSGFQRRLLLFRSQLPLGCVTIIRRSPAQAVGPENGPQVAASSGGSDAVREKGETMTRTRKIPHAVLGLAMTVWVWTAPAALGQADWAAQTRHIFPQISDGGGGASC